jgi:WD40 repeat protein
MTKFENENILKITLETLATYQLKQVLDKSTNKTLIKLTLSILNFEKIFKSMGKSKNISTQDNETILSSIHLKAPNYQSAGSIMDDRNTINIYNDTITVTNDCKLKIINKSGNLDLLIDLGSDIQEIVKLTPLSNGILAVVISYHDQLSIIKILDCSDNYKIIKTFREHAGWIPALVNLPNNRFATGSFDRTIKIWDFELDICVHTIQETSWVFSLMFIDKLGLLLSGACSGLLKLWDISSYKCVRIIKAHNKCISCFLLLPSGYFVTGACDTNIKIWDLNGFECIKTLEGHKSDICTLKFLNDYRLASFTENTVILWNY